MKATAILLAAAAFIAASPASAAEMPAQYRGEWCAHGPYYAPYAVEPCDRRKSDGYMRVTAKGFSGWETDCKLLNAKLMGKIEGKFADHILTLDCKFEGGRERTERRFSTTPSRYNHGLRLYIEDVPAGGQ